MKRIFVLILFVLCGFTIISGTSILLSGCSQNATIKNPELTLPEAVIPSGYKATLSFSTNTTETVTNMPSSVSTSSSMVLTTPSGWSLTVTIPSNIPKRTGYTFLHWNENSSGTGAEYDPGDSCGVSATSSSIKSAFKTLYAIWQKNAVTTTYTASLVFNANTTASVSNMPSTTYRSSKTVMSLIGGGWYLSVDIPSNYPTRSGYTFQYWSENTNGTGTKYYPGGSCSVSQSNNSLTSATKTLYAIWTVATYTIVFNSNGGTGSMSSKTVTVNSDWFSVGNAFTKSEFEFMGWTISGMDSSLHYYGTSTTNYSTTTSSTIRHSLVGVGYYKNLRSSSGTIVFTARWAKYVMITYQLYGSSNAPLMVTTPSDQYLFVERSSITGPYGMTNIYYEYGVTATKNISIVLSISDSNGYVMDLYRSNMLIISQPSSKTVTISWSNNSNVTYVLNAYQKYIVSFNTGGGSVSTSSKEVTYQSTYGSLPTPTRGGYTFNGWFTASSGGSQISSSTTVTTAANHTIYAQWSANVYRVDINIYNPSGAQDYASGTASIYYSYTGVTNNNVNNEVGSSYCRYNQTIVISNIQPITDYYLSSVTCGGGTITQSGNTYTYTATMTGTPNGGYDDTIVIQMAWKAFPININILNPAGEEDTYSGTMNLQYSDGVTATNTNNEVVVEGNSKTLRCNQTIIISNIIPAEQYSFKSISCDRGSLVDNGDGSYTYTANFVTSPNGTSATIIIQMSNLFYNEDEGYYYVEDGEYPQGYAAVEWDEYSGDGNYGGAHITYNKTNNILTIDGTMTAGTGTILRARGITFSNGQVYTVYREYIDGSVTLQNNSGNSFVIDTIARGSDNTPSTRNNNDAGFSSFGSSNLTINQASASEADGFKFWIWLNGGTATFDNYQIKICVAYDKLLDSWSKTQTGDMPNPSNPSQTAIIYSVNTAIADVPSGTEFTKINNRWFKIEPIQWAVTDLATKLTVNCDGGWEVIGIAMDVKENTDYTVSLSYSMPNYTPLSGYNGVAFMVLNAAPTNSDCRTISITYSQLPSNQSKGEVSLTFNTSSLRTVCIALNFGYVADGASYTFEFGNLRVSDKSVVVEKNICKWVKYQYGDRFTLSETDIIANNGRFTNLNVASANVLSFGSVETSLQNVNVEWSFMQSENIVTSGLGDYTVSGNNIKISYSSSSNQYTLTNTASSDPYATIYQTVELTKGAQYVMSMDVTNSSGASIGRNVVQVFYAVNGSYSESNSLRFGDSTTIKAFIAPTTGVYRIRFDNDYGNTVIIKNFEIKLRTPYQSTLNYAVQNSYETFRSSFSHSTFGTFDIDVYGMAGQQEKVFSALSTGEGLRVVSINDMENLGNISAKASDMVAYLLGTGGGEVKYWTRNLGSSLRNGYIVTEVGDIKSNWVNKQNGARLSITLTY